MSVTDVNYISTQGSESEDGTVEYDVVLEVITNAVTDGAKTVLAYSGVPKRGDLYSYGGDTDPTASCRSRSATTRDPKETRKLWRVALKYSSKGSSQDPGGNSGGDPVDFSWHLSLGTNSRMVAPDKDRNDRSFVNTAGEPFLPPPEEEEKFPVLRFTKNSPSINLAAFSEAPGKVNSVAMWGAGVRLFKLADWTAEPHFIGPGAMYWSQTFTVEIKWGGHYFQPPNMGHRELVFDLATAQFKPRAIVDALFIPVSRPVALNELGAQRAPNDPVLFFDQVGGALQKFEIEHEYDLSQILPPVLPGNFT